MKGPQEIKTRPTIQEFCFSEYTQGNENSNSVRYLHSRVYYSAIHNSQNMETTQKTTNKWRGKKDFLDPGNHDDVITHLEPDIPECKIKWALGSITMNKASGGNGMPAN